MGSVNMTKNNQTNELTGLLTISRFREVAHQALENTDLRAQGVSFIYLDIENFKNYNEIMGFSAGDEVLQFMAKTIDDEFNGRHVAYFGSDHFVILARNSEALVKTKTIIATLDAKFGQMSVNVKAGIYTLQPDDDIDISVCCDRAKIACDSIKHKYDASYCFYTNEMGRDLWLRRFIPDQFPTALASGHIKVNFQPIVRALTDDVCGLEALVRWNDPDYGFISPGQFVPVLEQAHLVHKLDIFVIEEVCRAYKCSLVDSNLATVPVSVNLSRLDFSLCDIYEEVERLIKKYDVPKDMLHIEVTETGLNEEGNFLRDGIIKFQENGYQVWMDDFGSGYSSFNVLKDYDFDVLKLDMKFLADFEKNENAHIIIASIVSMAKKLGVRTVTEGVETKEQWEFLKSIGCDMGQGYFFNRPAPLEQIWESMTAKRRGNEELTNRSYYDAIDKIDLKGSNPFSYERRKQLDQGLPLAIAELRNGSYRFLKATPGFVKLIRTLGVKSVKECEELFNDTNSNINKQINRLLENSTQTGEVSEIDFVMNGNYANISVRYIDQDANSTAFLLEVANLSQNRGLARSKKREEAMRFIYSLFDRVELINLSEGTVENLYRNNMHTSSILRGGAVKEVVDNYAQENIHPDDIAKFRKFYDENTMEERIKAEGGKKYITEYLRTKDENGHYCWKLYCIVPFPLNNNRMLLSCVFDVDAKKSLKLIGQMAIKKDVLSDSDGKISRAILWANLLAMSQFGVYWKDTDRRFIGANQTYLSYNSLKSEQELIGKREEELGWELNPDFRIDEDQKVLTEGEQVVNREGTMIVDGNLRNIATSKSPIYDTEGKIIGLMGYIIDITMESRDSKGLLNLAFTDLLTGILNRRGLMDALLEYEQMYLKRKADFVIAYVDVDNFTDFNDKNGRSYGDRLLSEVAYTLRNRLGKSCVVGRIGSDEFVLLKRVKDLGDASQLQALIRATVADIHQIGNKPCQVSASVGTALFSEVDNTQQLLRKADRKMQMDKHGHSRLTKMFEV